MRHHLPTDQQNDSRAHYGGDSTLPEEEETAHKYTPGDGSEVSNSELMIYRDKDGLPVTYDATTEKQRKATAPDELSMLWHEVLTPLTVIKGYTGTLLDLSHATTEEQKRQYLRGIESASNRMIRLMENLRDISRLEDSGTLKTRSISINTLIRQIASEIQSQTTKHVIKICPTERLPLVKVEPERIEQVIYPVGFYRNKARSILAISQELIDHHEGQVPDDLDELLKLPGVGRKTANLVVTIGYNKPGICVDTHVHRICNHWGYIQTKTPEKTEFALRRSP